RHLFFRQGSRRRRPHEAGSGRSRRAHRLLRNRRRRRQEERCCAVPGGLRHQHGGAARVGGDCRLPVGAHRVQGAAGGGQADLRRLRHRSQTPAGIPGRRPGRPDARVAGGLALFCIRTRSDSNPTSVRQVMDKLGQSPFTWLKFDEDGKIEKGAVAALTKLLAAPDVADLVVISHGWKNNEKDATDLYGKLWKNACLALASRKPANVVVAGVLWPAKEYETDFDDESLAAAAGGQALAVGSGGGAQDLPDKAFKDVLESFRDLFGAKAAAPGIAAAKEAAKGLNGKRADDLLDAVVKAARIADKKVDPELAADGKPFTGADDAQVLIEQLLAPPQFAVSEQVGKAQNLGDVVTGLFRGPRAAVARFLNQTTYYEMKKRA